MKPKVVEIIDETALLVKVRIGDAEFWRPKAERVDDGGCEFELYPTGKCGKQPTTMVGIQRPVTMKQREAAAKNPAAPPMVNLQRYNLCRDHAEAAVRSEIGVEIRVGTAKAA